MALKGSHWQHGARTQIMGRTKGATKPPKLRFRPGQFFRLKRSRGPGYEVGQLYCCVWIYRTVEEPNIWKFVLEERKGLSSPSTTLSTMCAAVAGEVPFEERIKWQPIYRHEAMDLDPRDYCHGDRTLALTKDLLNDYDLVSDGEA
jgi:hypothetical protein